MHGLERDLVAPDWPPLAGDEVRQVLGRWFGREAEGAEILWRSPRPLSAAALVRLPQSVVFVKRHHRRVRNLEQLALEHALSSHLRYHGVAVPAAFPPAVQLGEWVYEVHAQACGLDLYRDAASWTGFMSLGHAWSAGAGLAQFHGAAASFEPAERPPGVLVGSCALTLTPDLVEAVAQLTARRPGLARSITAYPWEEDFARHLAPLASQLARSAQHLPRAWAHCDWHPSNLTWTAAGPQAGVAEVIDLGLANLTFAAHDIATAIERCTISWLDLAGSGHAEADLDSVDAFLDGYEAVRPLPPGEATALPAVLPAVHIEYALSEVEYYADIVGSPQKADVAYKDYLLGHARWFQGPDGARLIEHLGRRST